MRISFAVAFFVFCATIQAQVTVVNGASFRTDQPVSAGSWATVVGAFTGVAPATAPAFPLPKNLGGVTLTVAGIEVPLYYVSANQINFLVPYAVTPGVQPVQVKTPAATVAGSVRVITSGPGLFIKDATNQQPPKGAILNQDSTENTSSNTARRGQVVQIYATGPGRLDNTLADGVVPPSSPLIRTVSTPQVFIGGVESTVHFSGLAPGLPGVWQINVTVPERGFLSGRVPLQVFMDGVESNEVTIFVAP